MEKINEEIEKIAKKFGGTNEPLRFNLEFALHGLALTVVREYREAMKTEEYKNDEVRFG